MNGKDFGLEKGPWSICYYPAMDEPGHITRGFTFISAIDPGGDPQVTFNGEFMFAINFDADGTMDACVRASEAFNKAGFKDSPEPDSVKLMIGVKNNGTKAH